MFAVGVTVALVPVTAPIPGVIFNEVAPFTTQASVVARPATTVVGVAVKELMVGFGGGGVTGTVSVLVPVPAEFRAVSV